LSTKFKNRLTTGGFEHPAMNTKHPPANVLWSEVLLRR